MLNDSCHVAEDLLNSLGTSHTQVTTKELGRYQYPYTYARPKNVWKLQMTEIVGLFAQETWMLVG